MQATQRAADRIGMPWITPVSALLTAIGGIGGVGAWLAASGRLTFVAGVDRFLPPAFGRIHPRWHTPHVALITQGIGAALFAVLGQAGTGVKGAYDALVAMTAIAYFIPILGLFAAHLVLQREPAGAGVVRAPGGRPVALLLGALGFVTTAVSMVLAMIPPADSTNRALATWKVIGGTLLLIVLGTALYWRGRQRARRARSGSPAP
ncbi:MAG: amino acid permease, partial [Candidatus Eiseniibacteriota bacterium]